MQHDAGETWPTPATLYRNPPPAQQPRDSYPANASLLPGLPFGSHGNNFTMAREFLKKKTDTLNTYLYIYTFLLKMEVLLQKLGLGSGK